MLHCVHILKHNKSRMNVEHEFKCEFTCHLPRYKRLMYVFSDPVHVCLCFCFRSNILDVCKPKSWERKLDVELLCFIAMCSLSIMTIVTSTSYRPALFVLAFPTIQNSSESITELIEFRLRLLCRCFDPIIEHKSIIELISI